jgi:hypothetical protein
MGRFPLDGREHLSVFVRLNPYFAAPCGAHAARKRRPGSRINLMRTRLASLRLRRASAPLSSESTLAHARQYAR